MGSPQFRTAEAGALALTEAWCPARAYLPPHLPNRGQVTSLRYPDTSTLSGFGDEAANEAFCASETVPNSKFGPHRVGTGNILVR
jgi:hypothetical protein